MGGGGSNNKKKEKSNLFSVLKKVKIISTEQKSRQKGMAYTFNFITHQRCDGVETRTIVTGP